MPVEEELPVSPEEIQEFEKLEARLQSLSPEQRQEIIDGMRASLAEGIQELIPAVREFSRTAAEGLSSFKGFNEEFAQAEKQAKESIARGARPAGSRRGPLRLPV